MGAEGCSRLGDGSRAYCMAWLYGLAGQGNHDRDRAHWLLICHLNLGCAITVLR